MLSTTVRAKARAATKVSSPPHLGLLSLQVPTAVLSTTVRAKARAAKKEQAKTKEGGEGEAGEAATGPCLVCY